MHRPICSVIAIATGCAAPAVARPDPAPLDSSDVARLRARGPDALQLLLARFDAMAPGADRDELAVTIDAVAAQRYATVSRLYWYTELGAAQAAARARHRPILALRMLGRLDEDLSCANSRLFRATLYANRELSRLLRDNFVLFWSSERAVPRVTIDFGDGRKLERTTTGNSAHYVLDQDGHVLDVLPGLYSPAAFRSELAKSVQLAAAVARLPDAERAAAVRAHHQAEWTLAATTFGKLAGTQFLRGRRRLLAASELDTAAVERAQRATMSKMVIEVPDLATIGIDAGAIPADDVAAWAVVGQKAWGIIDLAKEPSPVTTAGTPASPRLLDPSSLALVRRLHDAGPARSSPAELAAMIARLEQHIVADTALNQFSLRQQIRARIIADADRDWPALNAWIYADVFHTPRSDPWLGLLPRTDFTGLPGDGVVMP